MPYIEKKKRLKALIGTPKTGGEKNYALTEFIIGNYFMDEEGEFQFSYTILDKVFNDLEEAIATPVYDRIDKTRFTKLRMLAEFIHNNRIGNGTIRLCMNELYRRLGAPYEDAKIVENGEVFPRELLDKAHASPPVYIIPKGQGINIEDL